MPSICVVIATYNRPDQLRSALLSVVRQSHAPDRVVVVNDGGIDVAGVVAEFERGLTIDYMTVEHGGVGAARNAANQTVEEDVIFVFDDDDIMLPNCLAATIDAFERQRCDIAYGSWINFNGPAGFLDFCAGKAFSLDTLMFSGLVLTHGAMAGKAEIFRNAPYRSELLGGADFDLISRLARDGLRFVHSRAFLILRRSHGERIGTRYAESQQNVRQGVLDSWHASLNLSGAALADREAKARSAPLAEGSARPNIDRIARMADVPTIDALEFPINRRLVRNADLIAEIATYPILSLSVFDDNPSSGTLWVRACVRPSGHSRARLLEPVCRFMDANGYKYRLTSGNQGKDQTVFLRQNGGDSGDNCELTAVSIGQATQFLDSIGESSLGWLIYSSPAATGASVQLGERVPLDQVSRDAARRLEMDVRLY